MRKRTVVAFGVVLLMVLTGAESCPDPSPSNPAERRQEEQREESGDLPGESDVMLVHTYSEAYPYLVVVTRKTYNGQIREVYNRWIEEESMSTTVDFRTDDQSLSVVATKVDAPEGNFMGCTLRRINREYNDDEQTGGREVVCVWIGMVGNRPEA